MSLASLSLEEKISEILTDTLEMMKLAQRSLDDSVRALDDHDIDLANSVVQRDMDVDRLEQRIEAECLDVLAGPLEGKRLRVVATTYKIIGDLERIGDYAVAVSNVAIAVANKPITKQSMEITRMATLAKGMLQACEDAYEGKSPIAADEIFKQDEQIDKLYNCVFVNGLTTAVHEPETITNLLYITLAARALERIGDHITNIAERLEYIETGKLTQRGLPMHVPERF